MAETTNTERGQTSPSAPSEANRRTADNAPDSDLTDWNIEHNPNARKAHPGNGEHYVGNAAEAAQAPITNEPADQTRPHGNRPKGQNDGKIDHN